MPYLPGKNKTNQLEALGHLIDYANGRAEYATNEDEHITACKVSLALNDVRKLINSLSDDTSETSALPSPHISQAVGPAQA